MSNPSLTATLYVPGARHPDPPEEYFGGFIGDSGGTVTYLYGAGSPEGVVTATPGRTYWDQTGDILWVKDSGSGNTGWVEYEVGGGSAQIASGVVAPVGAPAAGIIFYVNTVTADIYVWNGSAWI